MAKKILKIIGKVILIITLLIAILTIISFTIHRIKLNNEKTTIITLGERVLVNNHYINVYTEGIGDKTLVFMSGGGTCSPVLDFKSLFSKLSDDYKIVVVEKAGYGFSDDSNVSRDIDTILYETRTSLELTGHMGPYILLPHSMSGIEALYWAQKYPEEVSAIIGLDMAVPENYENMNINMGFIKLLSLSAKLGYSRLIPGLANSEAIKNGSLSDEEKELYKKVFFQKTLTNAMINEMKEIKSNAKIVDDGTDVDVPILLFSSNGEGTGHSKDIWQGYHQHFVSKKENRYRIILDSPHYVHDYEYHYISEEIIVFIEGLSN